MGQEVNEPNLEPEAIRTFTKAVLNDLRALERMLRDGLIESGIRRFGAEQELFLVDEGWRPAPVALAVLDRLKNPAFTTELARFNLEINLDPALLDGTCFRTLHARLDELIQEARDACRGEGAEVVLTGTLPTLSKSDLVMENITPKPRYFTLNQALTRLRGGSYRLQIEGTDELNVEHDSVLLEACNTSCQVHLQVSAEEFPLFYNVAQLVVAPALAAAVNSPLLFGRRLWDETRIALFQQSLDTRASSPHPRDVSARVRFGGKWIRSSVTELFQEDLALFRVLMAGPVTEDSLRVLDEGGIPKLEALQLYNSTVYRWNRPCYGVKDGKAHLRIECRALPSGPSVADEVANAAFWLGLVIGGVREYGDVSALVEFDDAKANFLAAARHGLNAGFQWVDGETIGAARLITEKLLPLARKGLLETGVDEEDVEKYLGIVRSRVESRLTGSAWTLKSLAKMKQLGTREERLAALTAGTAKRQHAGDPVHLWSLAVLREGGVWKHNYMRVEQYMTTNLVTVNEDELVDLVAFLMDREQFRHVPVEDDAHRLVGLVSYRSILRLVADRGSNWGDDTPPVKEIMERGLTTVAPETPTLEAIDLMRKRKVSCLPVLKQGKLVGLVTERDFMPMAYDLLEERLREA